jgi:RNA polymerase sigma-70 factor (ECF subfamily)
MDPQKLSPQELVQLCLDSQDHASWTEFVRQFQPTIAGAVAKHLFLRRRANPDLIDDLTQETYIRLFANNRKALRSFEFRHERAFFGFLKVVASHVVEDYIRKSSTPDPDKEEDIDTIPLPAPCNHDIDPAELAVLLREVDECLNENVSDANFTRDYTIFWLYYRQGLSARAISELPGINLNVKGVESALLRLTCMLRARLAIPRK